MQPWTQKQLARGDMKVAERRQCSVIDCKRTLSQQQSGHFRSGVDFDCLDANFGAEVVQIGSRD